MDFYSLLRPLLFTMPAETAHHFTLNMLKTASAIPRVHSLLSKKDTTRAWEKQVAGLNFPNPVGLAAGLDKNAEYYNELAELGFGFVEIGTVTPRPQLGNPKSRLFRLPKDKALINRMGFNNHGADAVAERLKNRKSKIIVGANIGKNKDTPNDDAHKDYISCFKTLAGLADYFVINVSSPNTPNLRELQEKDSLLKIISAVLNENDKLSEKHPVFLKIAPDLSLPQIEQIVEIAHETGLQGIIATNTTISREGLSTSKAEIEKIGNGGLSGKPLTARSTEIIRQLKQLSGGKFALIASGGVMTASDAHQKLDAGADLVQIYTGFVYGGPVLIGDILNRKQT